MPPNIPSFADYWAPSVQARASIFAFDSFLENFGTLDDCNPSSTGSKMFALIWFGRFYSAVGWTSFPVRLVPVPLIFHFGQFGAMFQV